MKTFPYPWKRGPIRNLNTDQPPEPIFSEEPNSYLVNESEVHACKTGLGGRHTNRHPTGRRGTENRSSPRCQYSWMFPTSCHLQLREDFSYESGCFRRRTTFLVDRKRGIWKLAILLIPLVWQIQASCHGHGLGEPACKTCHLLLHREPIRIKEQKLEGIPSSVSNNRCFSHPVLRGLGRRRCFVELVILNTI